VAKLLLRTLEFAFYHLLICLVDRLNRLPRDSCPPDAMRLYPENLARLGATPHETCLVHHGHASYPRPPCLLSTREVTRSHIKKTDPQGSLRCAAGRR
jgi:hypothetical protein